MPTPLTNHHAAACSSATEAEHSAGHSREATSARPKLIVCMSPKCKYKVLNLLLFPCTLPASSSSSSPDHPYPGARPTCYIPFHAPLIHPFPCPQLPHSQTTKATQKACTSTRHPQSAKPPPRAAHKHCISAVSRRRSRSRGTSTRMSCNVSVPQGL